MNNPMETVFVVDDDASTSELAGTLGVVAFFRKPVDDQALIDTIEWAMREKKQREIDGKNTVQPTEKRKEA